MRERAVEISELRTKLSGYIREVKKGATIVVTEHGRPVARIVRETEPLDAKLRRLRAAGVILWNGRRLAKTKPVARVRGKRTVADIVVENRE